MVRIIATVIFLAPLLADAARVVSRHGNLNTTGNEQLNDWVKWAGRFGAKGFPDILVPLIEGVFDAGFGEAVTWVAPDVGDTGDSGVLTLQLNVPKIYREMSSGSRVPIMWTLANKVTFTFPDGSSSHGTSFSTMNVYGLGDATSKQGVELYEEVLKTCSKCTPEACDPTGSFSDKKIPDCLNEEVKAAGKYLKKNWKKIKADPRKITNILKTSYDITSMWLAAKGNWPKIFYSLIASASGPASIDSFSIDADGWVSSTGAKAADNGHHMSEKSRRMGLDSLKSGANRMSLVLRAAKSGMNMAMMSAHGVPDSHKELLKVNVRAGDTKAIGNTVGACANAELDSCKGKVKGRLHWTTTIPATMA